MTLIPKSLKTQLYKAIRDSASEHGARMTAMHKATDNATDLRNELKLTYNKARQASITNEILEIVGGAEERIRKKFLYFSNLQIASIERIRKISLFFKSSNCEALNG
jgi:hypothetical protein